MNDPAVRLYVFLLGVAVGVGLVFLMLPHIDPSNLPQCRHLR